MEYPTFSSVKDMGHFGGFLGKDLFWAILPITNR